MKILLVAYVDTNFGDNLFVQIITSRYPKDKFYMIQKKGYEKSYQLLAEKIPNLNVVKEESNYLEEVDGMMIVGGDMFWDYDDYSLLISQASSIKNKGGQVAIIGISLFPKYSRRTWFDLQVLFSYADVILVRERKTYEQIKEKNSKLPVIAATDLALTVNVDEIKENVAQKGLLGISVRKKEQKQSELYYPRYCRNVADSIVKYLEESEQHKVKLLALSSGRIDDRTAASDIIELCPKYLHERITCSAFTGDVNEYLLEMQKCDKLLCTRFHALVFAILLHKPFLPIIYEEKMDRLLDEIGYRNIRLRYEDGWSSENILENILENQYDEAKFSGYKNEAESVFIHVDKAMKKNRKKGMFVYRLYLCKEYARRLCHVIKMCTKKKV